MTDVESLTVEDFETAEALCWILSRHARHLRDEENNEERAEELFEIDDRLHDELVAGRGNVDATFTGDDLELLYEGVEYTVKNGAGGPIKSDDVEVAVRIYEELGGDVEEAGAESDQEGDEDDEEPADAPEGEA